MRPPLYVSRTNIPSLLILPPLIFFFPLSAYGCQQTQGTATSVQKISEQETVGGSEGTGVLETEQNKDDQDPFPKDPEKYKPMPLPDPDKHEPQKIVGDPEETVSHPVGKKE